MLRRTLYSFFKKLNISAIVPDITDSAVERLFLPSCHTGVHHCSVYIRLSDEGEEVIAFFRPPFH